jgi:uncharacterized membrane protein
MKAVASLIKTTAVGGLVFVLPLVAIVVIVGKAFNIIKTISKPVAELISAEAFLGYAVADLIAIIALLLITLLAGVLARSPVFDSFYQKLDAVILQLIPGYSWVKGMTGSLSDSDAEKTLVPVAVIQDDIVQFGYEVERLPDDWVAVYLPGAPDSRSGTVGFFTSDRIRPLDASFAGIASCLKKLGRGSSEILSPSTKTWRSGQQ